MTFSLVWRGSPWKTAFEYALGKNIGIIFNLSFTLAKYLVQYNSGSESFGDDGKFKCPQFLFEEVRIENLM